MTRTHNGMPVRLLTIMGEFTRECLAIKVARKRTAHDVLDELFEPLTAEGVPDYLRSDYGPEFTTTAVREWLGKLGVTTLFIEPGSPWENGYIESFRDELLNREIFTTLWEAKVLIEGWRCEYNHPAS